MTVTVNIPALSADTVKTNLENVSVPLSRYILIVHLVARGKFAFRQSPSY